ncbi:FAD-dependent monooxygenase [Flavihumibacter rivuli]|uniref:FAD-dependent monooxygenase n=1 Tax=Flavihumibacter rivuli TaxID=2838156 RepID=UPI001BDEA8C2|nr:FAD-dependent monooxygenase [Flavihumibacter rivuli]ULQ55193.1 FAD-dependent monooxygenase [Flavihumibacter rivuli]
MTETYTIVGGGIAGLCAAIALRRIGLDPLVVEAAPAFKPIGAGLTLAANAMQALRHLGIAEQVKERGRIMNAFTIYDEKGKVIKRVNTDPHTSRYGISNFNIHRADLHEVLFSFLPKDRVLTGKRTVDLQATDGGYRLQFEDGSQLETTYLIVAEGIHSPIRSKLVPDSHLRYAGYTCWRGIADNSRLQVNETSETWGSNGRFGIVPLNNHQIYWFATKNSEPMNFTYQHYTIEQLMEHYQDYHAPIREVLSSTPANGIIWDDLYDLAPLEQYAFGHILLMGDAAHATTPNMGQGACMAIEDAVVLGECLKQHNNVAHAFNQFEKQRKERTQWVVKQSRSIGAMAQVENKLLAGCRDMVFRMMPDGMYRRQLEKVYEFKV